MSETLTGSLPWIPNDVARAKYEDGGEKQAYGEKSVTGPVVDHGTRERYNGDGEYDVITLEVEGIGRVAIHCQATVLERQMKQARPFNFGDTITVTYKGEVEGRNDRSYHDYEVSANRPEGGAIQWADGTTATPPPEPQQAGPVPSEAPKSQLLPDDDVPF